MGPLRILLLNSARRWIGEAAHTFALAEGLLARGHAVRVGLRRGFELEGRARRAGLDVLPLGMNSRFRPVEDLRDRRTLRALVDAGEVDLVHANRGKDHWLAAAAAVPGPRRVPLVRARHVVTPVHQHLANRWLYGRATDGVLSVSRAAHASLGPLAALAARGGDREAERAALEGSAPTCRIVYSAVDGARLTPARRTSQTREALGAGEDTILVGLIGRIQRVKGQRDFLTAAARVAREHPATRFLIAGRGSEGQAAGLLEYAKSEGLNPDRLLVLGVMENLPAVLAALDVGVVASIGSEGSSRVTLEYMASGVAAVATRVGGIPELLDDGVQGFLVDPRDPDRLARRIGQLASDAGLRAQMGAAGRRAAEGRFRPDRWLDEIEAFYEAVLAAHRERREGR